MMARALWLIALAGCSEHGSQPDAPAPPPDVGELACGGNGSAVVRGAVGGAMLDPVVHVMTASLNGAFAGLVIENSGTGCNISLLDDALEIVTCSPTLATG